MKKIYLGTFFGYNMNLEIPTREYNKLIKQGFNADVFYQEQHKEYLKSIEDYAVEKYKGELYLKKLKTKKWWQKLW